MQYMLNEYDVVSGVTFCAILGCLTIARTGNLAQFGRLQRPHCTVCSNTAYIAKKFSLCENEPRKFGGD